MDPAPLKVDAFIIIKYQACGIGYVVRRFPEVKIAMLQEGPCGLSVTR